MPVQDDFPEYCPDQRAFFDRLIEEDWDSYMSEAWDKQRVFEVAEIVRRSLPTRVLDLGCGVGFHDVVLAGYSSVEAVHGIDYSSQSILKANRYYPHPKVTRQQASFSEFSGNNQFDLIVSFQVFEHLEDVGEFFRCCRRSLAPGGQVVIATPNRRRLLNRARTILGREEEVLDPMHWREYTLKELRATSDSYGFTYKWSFAYGLEGPWISRLPTSTKLRLGRWMRPIAQIVVSSFSTTPGDFSGESH